MYDKAYHELENFAVEMTSNPSDFLLVYSFYHFLFFTVLTQGLASSTIMTYVSAIGYFIKLVGHTDPENNFVIKKMLKGYSILNQVSDVRLPITYPILPKLIAGLKYTTGSLYERATLQAIFLLASQSLFCV